VLQEACSPENFLTTAGSASGFYFRLGHRCRALTELGDDIRTVEITNNGYSG